MTSKKRVIEKKATIIIHITLSVCNYFAIFYCPYVAAMKTYFQFCDFLLFLPCDFVVFVQLPYYVDVFSHFRMVLWIRNCLDYATYNALFINVNQAYIPFFFWHKIAILATNTILSFCFKAQLSDIARTTYYWKYFHGDWQGSSSESHVCSVSLDLWCKSRCRHLRVVSFAI